MDAGVVDMTNDSASGRQSRVVLISRRWYQAGGIIRRWWWQESPAHQGEREGNR